MTTARDVIESFLAKPDRSEDELLELLHARSGCGRRWDGKEFMLTPTHVILDSKKQKRTLTHLQLLWEYREQLRDKQEETGMNEIQITQRKSIERRIAMHMQGAFENMVEVGRCLIEAKETGAVQHGEWERWAQAQTGFSIRQCERLMQAAREVKPGSALARLSISKIQTILSLPEGEREAAAQKAVDENQTVQQMRKEIAEANRKRETAERLRDTAQAALTTAQEEFEGKIAGLKSELSDLKVNHEQEILAIRQKAGEANQEQIDAMQREIDGLRSGEMISVGSAQRIRDLEDEIESVNAYAEEQARLRSEAQAKLLNLQASAGTSDQGRMNPMAIIPDIQNLIGTWAILPHMSDEISRLSDRERETLKASLRLLAKFAVESQESLREIYYVEAE